MFERCLGYGWAKRGGRSLWVSVTLSVVLMGVLLLGGNPAIASLTDDHYDGNIFPLYAGNGSLVPPRITLADSLRTHTPAILVLYVDDSTDCKQFAPVISQLDAFYGRAADILPISIDSIPVKDQYNPSEPGYYLTGYAPQTVVFDKAGRVVLNESGVIPYERIDDVLREVFDLLPRSESVELKRRIVNEINTELVPQ
ncbi:thylakoid membrane photosystem I accumulation factor [Thermoleptolyngbya sp.]